jgi:hypothetical protein
MIGWELKEFRSGKLLACYPRKPHESSQENTEVRDRRKKLDLGLCLDIERYTQNEASAIAAFRRQGANRSPSPLTSEAWQSRHAALRRSPLVRIGSAGTGGWISATFGGRRFLPSF